MAPFDVQLRAELKSQLRIVLMELANKPGDPTLEQRAEEITAKIRDLSS